GVNIDTVVDTTVALTLDGIVTANGDVTVRAEGEAEGDATARGVAEALIGSGGVVQADLTVDGEVVLTLRPGTEIYGDDVTIAAIGGSAPTNAGIPGATAYSIGDGRSNLPATGFAGAAFAGSDNRALAEVDETVTVFVDGTGGQPSRIEAEGALAITADNHAAVASFAGGGGGGAISASFSNTRAILTATTEVIVGDRDDEAGEDNVVLVAETADIAARAFLDVRATADTDAGSVLGSHSDADARASLFHTTRAGLGRAARVNAPETSIVAETSHDVITVMTADSSGGAVDALAGRNGVDGSPAGSYLVGGSLTEVFADADSEIVALDTLELRAEILDADIRSTAQADSDAAGAVSKATAVADADEDVRVTVDEDADLKGRTELTLAALVADGAYAISTDSYARFDGLLGANTAESYTTGEVATLIDARDAAVLRTRSLVVDATNGLDAGHGMSATATRHNFVEGDKPGSEWIVTDLTSANILFDADVELIRPFFANATLEINASGTIVTANNVTVNGGLDEGDNVGAGAIEVDALRINATGDAVFRAGTRGVIRGDAGAWSVQQGAGDISIVSDSQRDLIIGDIDAIGHRVPTSGEDVLIDVGDARAFTFDVVGIFDVDGADESEADTLVSIVNNGGDVIIAGLIDNPLGTTHIFADGDILDGHVVYTEDGYVDYAFDDVDDPGLIRTLRLELEATGSIGSKNDLRPYYGTLDVELVQSADHIPTADIYAHGANVYMQISQVIRSNALAGLAVIERAWASDSVEILFWPGRVETALPGDHAGGVVVRAQDGTLNDTAIGNDGPITNAAFYREFYFPDGPGAGSPDYLGAYGEATGGYRPTVFDVTTREPSDDFTLELFGPSSSEYPLLSSITAITRHYTLAAVEGPSEVETDALAFADPASAADAVVLDAIRALGLDGFGLAQEVSVAALDDGEVEVGWFDEDASAVASDAVAPPEVAPVSAEWIAIDPVSTLPRRIDWSARRLA
ncbi:MAG: hypothetical protein OEL76_13520, partial [Siculibacillus sp.]|nr:hypothetical protein [Siculibacillus sp.]